MRSESNRSTSSWLQLQSRQAALQEALQEASTLRDLAGNQHSSQSGLTDRPNKTKDYHVHKQSINS